MSKYILIGVGVLTLVIGLCVHRLESHSVHEAKDSRMTHEKKNSQRREREAGRLVQTQGEFRPGGVDKTKAAGSVTDARETGQRLDKREDTPSVIVQDKAALHSYVAPSGDQEVVDRSGTDDGTNEKTLDQWIVQLSGTDTQARNEALMAIKQYSEEEAAPKLKALMEQTEDQQLKAALREAITFIELPEYTPHKRVSTIGLELRHKAIRAKQ